MDLEPDPGEDNADDGEYFETDQKCSPESSPEIHELDGSSESDNTIELSSDSDEEEEERGYDVAESPSCWRSTPSDERGERVLIQIKTQPNPTTNHERQKTTKRDVSIPLIPPGPCKDPAKGWTVETVDGKHFIPCPECDEMVRIVGRLSLRKHVRSSHSEENQWGQFSIRNYLQCQICPPSSSMKRKIHASDVINHMTQKHRINYRGPMSHPAWVPTDPAAKTFICPECRLPVPILELKSHMKFYTLSTWKMAYPCSLCPKTKRKDHVHVKDLPNHLTFVHGISQDQLPSKDFIQCKGCKNPVKKVNLGKHLRRCRDFLVQDHLTHNKCSQSAALNPPPVTVMNPPAPYIPLLGDQSRIQCKGCPNQIKKINLTTHLVKCQGFQFCRGCTQSVLVQELSAHRSCGKVAALNLSEPQVPELIDDMASCTPGAVSVSRKGTPKAVQINLLQKRESKSNQKDSVDSESLTLGKRNEASMLRTGLDATSNSEAKGETEIWSSLEKRSLQSGSQDESAWKRKKTATGEEVDLTHIPS